MKVLAPAMFGVALIAAFAGVVGMAPGATALVEQITPFTVTLSFSAKALARLQAKEERVIIWTAYYAEPNDAGRPHVDEVGRIDLGYEKVEVASKVGTAKLAGRSIDRRKLAWITGDVQANINVYSARLSGPDNILDCDFYEGPLAVLERRGAELHCHLITEDARTEFKS